MSAWCWLALVGEPPGGALAVARVRETDGADAGALACWAPSEAPPARGARRMDARLLDPAGPPAVVSLVLAPDAVRLAFDDPAVQQARRAILAGPPFRAVSTLLSDASHFEGSIVVVGAGEAARAAGDPFARIFPARVLHVDAGLLGSVAPPAGPVIERYGSAQPWPWDRFPS